MGGIESGRCYGLYKFNRPFAWFSSILLRCPVFGQSSKKHENSEAPIFSGIILLQNMGKILAKLRNDLT